MALCLPVVTLASTQMVLAVAMIQCHNDKTPPLLPEQEVLKNLIIFPEEIILHFKLKTLQPLR